MTPVPAPLRPLVEQELARLCGSEALRRSQALVRLLVHLVERHLAGDANALRETSIALDVFRRDPHTYDPKADPIVRVSTGRLRERIAEHYATRPDAALRIVLPKGRYVPDYAIAGAAATPLGVAVTATRNATGDASLDVFCAALAERLADRLAGAGVPRVIARPSVDGAGGDRAEPTTIGIALGVAWVLASSVTADADDERGPSLRISARLIDARDGAQAWSDTRVVSIAQRHAAADRLVDAVVLHVLATQPSHGDAPRPPHTPHAMPPATRQAIDAARMLLLQRTVAATDEAVALASRAVEACPDAAAAHAALAAALYSRMTFQDHAGAPLIERIRLAAERALALDPTDAIALRTKAIVVGRHDWKFAEAATLFERALRAAPHYTSARLNYADLLMACGERERALAEVDLALLHDPLSPSVRLGRALALAALLRFDEARAEWSILRATGESSHWVLTGPARMEIAAGRLDVAAALAAEARARFPALPEPLLVGALCAAARGRRDEALALESSLRDRFAHYSPTNRAYVVSALRDRDGVLERLDEAIATRDLAFPHASSAPEFAWLAQDPGFLARLASAGVARWRGVPA